MIMIYLSVQTGNALFSGLLWALNKKQKSYLYLTTLWLGNVLNFGSQFYYNGNDLMMALTLGFYAICSFSLVKLYSYSVDDHDIPFQKFIFILLGCFVASCGASIAGLEFTYIALPMAIGVTFPMLFLSLRKIIPNWKKSDSFEKIFAGLLLLNSIHFLDYPFLRKNAEFAPIGFALAFVFMFVFTLFLPVFISKFLEMQNVKHLERKVQERTCQLNKLKDEKAQLVNILCHDLANPLMIIDMHLRKDIKQQQSNGGISKHAEKTKFAIGQIKSMLNQVKHMSAVEDGKSNIELEPTSPEKILKTCRNLFSERGDAKGIDLNFINEIKSEKLFLSNEVILVNDIISNFLSNAIKFTQEGGKIDISLVECDKEDKIRIKIADTGKGMDESKIQAILKNSKKTEEGTCGEKGTGLGLSVALFYIEKISATIDIESRPVETNPKNCGTDITISLDRISNAAPVRELAS